MGATDFMVTSTGKNAKEAFRNAVHRAEYDYGHRGYTGTIAEKDSYTMIPLPKDKDAEEYAEELIDECDSRINDKWGPAGCIDLGQAKFPKEHNEYLFFGIASC